MKSDGGNNVIESLRVRSGVLHLVIWNRVAGGCCTLRAVESKSPCQELYMPGARFISEPGCNDSHNTIENPDLLGITCFMPESAFKLAFQSLAHCSLVEVKAFCCPKGSEVIAVYYTSDVPFLVNKNNRVAQCLVRNPLQ